MLGSLLRHLGSGDLRVNLAWVGGPLADRCGQQAQRYPGVIADQIQESIAVQSRFGCMSRLDGADNLPRAPFTVDYFPVSWSSDGRRV